MTINPKSKEGWNTTKWSTIESCVFKTQVKIYNASKNGDLIKVRKLQHKLIDSWFAKLLAVRKVTQDNSGKKTAGVDGAKAIPPRGRLLLAKLLKIPTKPRPLRRVWVEKPGKAEKRPLGIPTIRDRATQALLKLALEPEWEARFEEHSYGFRPGRGCHDAMKQIYLSIFRKPKYVLDADIKKCFDKIDHKKLLVKLNYRKGKIHDQIKWWLESGVVDNGVFEDTLAGTPQGGIISPLLANVALHGMETMLKEIVVNFPLTFPNGGRMMIAGKRSSLGVVRYADDFVVMHYDIDVVLACQTALVAWLKEIGLELSPEKTKITHTLALTEEEKQSWGQTKPGFNFLGFTVRQFKAKYRAAGLDGINTLIVPSDEKMLKHQKRLGLIIRNSKTLSQTELIKLLNPIIVGWSRYFGTSDAETRGCLNQMDYLLYLKLRRWSKRKTKSAVNGFLKYFKKVGNRSWTFASKEELLLQHTGFATSLKKTYVKVLGESSPFDGKVVYWSARLGRNPLLTKPVAALLRKQKGRCALCNRRFVDGDLKEVDHIIPTGKGGSRDFLNTQLLHRHCHDQKDNFPGSP